MAENKAYENSRDPNAAKERGKAYQKPERSVKVERPKTPESSKALENSRDSKAALERGKAYQKPERPIGKQAAPKKTSMRDQLPHNRNKVNSKTKSLLSKTKSKVKAAGKKAGKAAGRAIKSPAGKIAGGAIGAAGTLAIMAPVVDAVSRKGQENTGYRASTPGKAIANALMGKRKDTDAKPVSSPIPKSEPTPSRIAKAETPKSTAAKLAATKAKVGGRSEAGKDFDKSFAAARRSGAKEFDWRGKKYNTNLAPRSSGFTPRESAVARDYRGGYED